MSRVQNFQNVDKRRSPRTSTKLTTAASEQNQTLPADGYDGAETGEALIVKANDTPAMLSTQHGFDLNEFLRINKKRFPGLKAKDKLEAGTSPLWLPRAATSVREALLVSRSRRRSSCCSPVLLSLPRPSASTPSRSSEAIFFKSLSSRIVGGFSYRRLRLLVFDIALNTWDQDVVTVNGELKESDSDDDDDPWSHLEGFWVPEPEEEEFWRLLEENCEKKPGGTFEKLQKMIIGGSKVDAYGLREFIRIEGRSEDRVNLRSIIFLVALHDICCRPCSIKLLPLCLHGRSRTGMSTTSQCGGLTTTSTAACPMARGRECFGANCGSRACLVRSR